MKHLKKYIVPFVFLAFVAWSYLFDFEAGEKIGINFWLFLKEMISLPVFIALGFYMEWYLRNKNFDVKQPE